MASSVAHSRQYLPSLENRSHKSPGPRPQGERARIMSRFRAIEPFPFPFVLCRSRSEIYDSHHTRTCKVMRMTIKSLDASHVV